MKRQKELPQRKQFLTEEVLNAISSNVFYGIGEPLMQREEGTHVPAEAYLDLVKALGCGAYRSWMHLTEVLKDPVTFLGRKRDSQKSIPEIWPSLFLISITQSSSLPKPRWRLSLQKWLKEPQL